MSCATMACSIPEQMPFNALHLTTCNVPWLGNARTTHITSSERRTRAEADQAQVASMLRQAPAQQSSDWPHEQGRPGTCSTYVQTNYNSDCVHHDQNRIPDPPPPCQIRSPTAATPAKAAGPTSNLLTGKNPSAWITLGS